MSGHGKRRKPLQNAVCVVRLEGPLQEAGLRQALRKLMTRHEILRTVFLRQPGMKIPFQVIRENLEPAWRTVDLSDVEPRQQAAQIDEIFHAEQTYSFDLESGPVLRATLAQIASQRQALVLSLPALCSDFQSLQNLVHEICLLYAGDEAKLNPEPLRYVQFAQWQSDLLESDDEAAQKSKAYWAKQIDMGTPALALPGELPAPALTSFQPETVLLSVPAAQCDTIDAAAGKYGASASSLLLSAWQALLSRISGQAIFAVGVFFDGREYEELQDALGIIGKNLPVPGRFDGNFRFSEVMQSVSGVMRQATESQEHFVAGEAELAAGFEYHELGAAQTSNDVRFRLERALVNLERYQLKLVVVQGEERGLSLEFHYDASRFERASVERIAGYFQTLLAAAVQAPETPVSRLPLLSQRERRQLLVDWNQTAADYPQDRCLHELFEAQAARTPERSALASTASNSAIASGTSKPINWPTICAPSAWVPIRWSACVWIVRLR